MRTLMDVIKDRHGTYYARKKVPQNLEGAVAQIVGAGKPRVSWLKKSLGTKDQKQANIRAKAALMEFDRTIENARATLKPVAIKVSLSDHEITRIAAYHFASVLGEDEEHRQGDEDDMSADPLRLPPSAFFEAARAALVRWLIACASALAITAMIPMVVSFASGISAATNL